MKSKFLQISALSVFFFICGPTIVHAQQADTLYVLFERECQNKVFSTALNRKKDQEYPLDQSRTFVFPKKVGKFTRELNFSYFVDYPEGSSFSFFSQKKPESVLNEKDFKDTDWFEQTDYLSIVEYFRKKDRNSPVIMLVDKAMIKNGLLTMIKVIFTHTAIE